MPEATSRLGAGCTQSLTGGELWAVGGLTGVKPNKIKVKVDARALQPGTYQATVLVRTDDYGASEVRVPVTVTVT